MAKKRVKSVNQVKPTRFVIEAPTLTCLGFEWYIEGDANRNAKVEVWYRKSGRDDWKAALPLFRIQNEENIFAFPPTEITDDFWGTPIYGATNNRIDYVAPNLFAGSIFDLEPGTRYECRFVMSDPDGVRGVGRGRGAAEKIVSVRTRVEPKPFEKGHIYHVYPHDYQGPRQEPAFPNIMAAYYIGWCVADWGNLAPPRVRPGDIILVHAGVYKEDWTAYGSDLFVPPQGQGANFFGTYFFTQHGTPNRPIAIQAAGDGEVIFDGNGGFNLFNVMGANYHYFEGLTIRNTDVAFWAGRKRVAGCSGLTVKRCRLENVGMGIHTDWAGSKNFYIADNVFIGRHDSDQLQGWYLPPRPAPYPYGKCLSEYAVKVAGQGHVICHNYIANFHDGIDHATYGVPDGYPAYGHPDVYPVEEMLRRNRLFCAIDIYNNFITNVHDDFIEADGVNYNIRVLRNLCMNSATNGLSQQTLYGGPAYFIRNVVYNAPKAIKHHAHPSGLIYYHNTFCCKVTSDLPASNYHFRNNLILGWMPSETVFSVDTFTNYTSSDYNGFRLDPGAASSFTWKSPSRGRVKDYLGERVERKFASLDEYSKATGEDKHSILIDFNVFREVKPPDPNDITKIYKAQDLDFRLNANTAAVDAGCILPNVNDDFPGSAPDLGALELGQTLPVYGPRPLSRTESKEDGNV